MAADRAKLSPIRSKATTKARDKYHASKVQKEPKNSLGGERPVVNHQ